MTITVVDEIRDLQRDEKRAAAVQYTTLLCDPARQTPTGVSALRAAAATLGRSLGQMNSDLGAIGAILESARLARTEAEALAAWDAKKQAVRDSVARIERMQSELLREREAHQRVVGESQAAAQAHGRARTAACGRSALVFGFWKGLGFDAVPDGAPESLRL